MFEAKISDATVVTLYLLPRLNLKLLPKLLAELKPGTLIVSHAFDMGSWKPQQTLSAGGTVSFIGLGALPGAPTALLLLAIIIGGSPDAIGDPRRFVLGDAAGRASIDWDDLLHDTDS